MILQVVRAEETIILQGLGIGIQPGILITHTDVPHLLLATLKNATIIHEGSTTITIANLGTHAVRRPGGDHHLRKT